MTVNFPVAICTLFEGDYHLGLAALANSLHKSGFRGTIWAGTRGPAPPWLATGMASVKGIRVQTVPIPRGWHLAHCKPRFMNQVLSQLQPEADAVFYFDPDITVIGPWPFFAQWASVGVALVEDGVYPSVHRTHPWRPAWRARIGAAGLSVVREVDFYVNSGFAAVARPWDSFLIAWHNILAAVAASGVNLGAFKPGDRSEPWFGTDQDALNAAIMATDVPLSIIGPDGMGFTPAGFVMHHAVDSPKPWRSRYLRRLLRTGTRPDLAHKHYWKNIDGPFSIFSASQIRAHRIDLSVAIGLSRLYRR